MFFAFFGSKYIIEFYILTWDSLSLLSSSCILKYLLGEPPIKNSVEKVFLFNCALQNQPLLPIRRRMKNREYSSIFNEVNFVLKVVGG